MRMLITTALLVALVLAALALARQVKDSPLPGSQQGYEPVQPIAFSHRQHAGQMQIACLYCHNGAERSAHAGIPAASLCMTCHRFVTAPQKDMLPEIVEARRATRAIRPVVSPELQALYNALALDDKFERDPKKTPRPIAWVRVHQLPSYACFNHCAHVRAGVNCQDCHGPVETMDRIRQTSDLSMGWCVNCHRDASKTGVNGKTVHASTDCATCHH